MKSEDIREIIEKKIKIYKNEWYNIWNKSIEELTIWFLDIWNSLFPLNKEKIDDNIKKTLSIKINDRLSYFMSNWFLEFSKMFIKLNIDINDMKSSTKDDVIINSFIKINEYIKNIDSKNILENDIIINNKDAEIKNMRKIYFFIKQILINNYMENIDYIKENKWNNKIIEYKCWIFSFYENVCFFIRLNKELLEKFYENWDLILKDEKKLAELLKIEKKVKNINYKKININIDDIDKYYSFEISRKYIFWN